MRSTSLLLIYICTLWIYSSYARDPSTNIDSFIDKSASIARISSAIAIQNGIFDEKQSTILDVIAEFLNIPSDVFKEFMKLDFDSYSKDIDVYYKSLDDVAKIGLTNADGLIDGLKLISGLKQKELYLEAIEDPTEHFKKSDAVFVSLADVGKEMVVKENLEKAIPLLKTIETKNAEDLDPDARKKHLESLQPFIGKLRSQLEEMQNYETILKDFFDLSQLKDKLSDFVGVIELAGNYSTTFSQIDPYRAQLATASQDAGKMRTVITENQKYTENVQKISSAQVLHSKLPHRKVSDNKYTLGLTGPDDLLKIESDLKSEWMKQFLKKDQDPASLLKALLEIKTLIGKYVSLQQKWQAFSTNKTPKETAQHVLQLAGEVYTSGKKVLEVSGTTTPFEEVSGCIQDLQPVKQDVDRDMFEKITDFAKQVFENVQSLKKVMQKIHGNGLEVCRQQIPALSAHLYHLSKANSTQTETIWKKVKGMKYKFSDSFESIVAALNELPPDPFYVPGDELDYDVIRSIVTVFDGTNVKKVTGCVEESSIDNLVATLSFIEKSATLKAKKQDFTTTSELYSSTSELQKNFKTFVDGAKTTKISNEANFLKTFETSEKVNKMALEIGGGVHSLRTFNQILLDQNSIMALVNSDVQMKTAVAQVPGSDKVFNDPIRNNLQAILGKIKELESGAKTMPQKSLKDLLSLYTQASKIDKTFRIDHEDFYEEIEEILSENPNPDVKAFAQHFKKVGEMELDFVQHNKFLAAAPAAFAAFGTFLTGFLKGVEDLAGIKDGSEKKESDDNILIIVCSVFGAILFLGAIGACVGICYCWRAEKCCFTKKKKVNLLKHNFVVTIVGKSKRTRKGFLNTEKGKEPQPQKCTTYTFKKPVKSLNAKDRAKYETEASKRMMAKIKETMHPKSDKSDKYLKPHPISVAKQLEMKRLLEHVRRTKKAHREVTAEKNFRNMGHIFIPAEPDIPVRAAALPDGIVLTDVVYDPNGNELWIIGSDEDSIELDSDFVLELTDSTEEEDNATPSNNKGAAKSKSKTEQPKNKTDPSKNKTGATKNKTEASKNKSTKSKNQTAKSKTKTPNTASKSKLEVTEVDETQPPPTTSGAPSTSATTATPSSSDTVLTSSAVTSGSSSSLPSVVPPPSTVSSGSTAVSPGSSGVPTVPSDSNVSTASPFDPALHP